jgi:enamine deaminase RidA (YjgF/YER057c/UK114 family)
MGGFTMVDRSLPDVQRIENLPVRKPGGHYVPYKQVGELIFLSGQTSNRPGFAYAQGQVGKDLTLEQGYEAAKICMEHLLRTLWQAVDEDWSRVIECVKVNGYVNSMAPFGDGPAVINGASDLVAQVLGDAGWHARSAVGVSALPGNASVEVEAVFRIKA